MDLQPKDIERFWKHVGKTESCWTWRGGVNSQGYGQLNINHRCEGAYRISYTIHFGPIPPGMMVCHRCDNPPCTRPDHLFLGTGSDNVRDMYAKFRAGKAGLIAAEIRDLYLTGEHSYADLANRFSVHSTTISRILIGNVWSGDGPQYQEQLTRLREIGNLRRHTKRPGSSRPGESHASHKLSRDQVDEIRGRYAAGDHTMQTLATKYGVCVPNIWSIVHHHSWKL